jgi:hypothetical protein
MNRKSDQKPLYFTVVLLIENKKCLEAKGSGQFVKCGECVKI